jgi:macrolide transport system ATP-binding/permease protein
MTRAMTWLRVIVSRLRGVFTRQRLDHEFDDELQDHLESLTEEYEAAGMSRGEARRAAVLKLGHPQQLREANRDYRGMPLLESLAQDLGFAFRTLRKSPGFTAVAVVTMALGIGLCSFLFSFMNGLLLRTAPGIRDPARLAAFQGPATYAYFERYRDSSRAASSTAAFIGPVPFGVAVGSAANAVPERISGHLVSYEYFSTLGARPLLGRFFDPALELPGGAPAVVVSERFWRMRLNADPRAIGRTLRVNGQRATIVGVAEKDFLGVFPATAADLFIPVTADPAVAPELAGDVLHNSASSVFQVVIRLAPNVTMAAAEAALDAQTRQLDRQNGKRDPARDKQGRMIRLVMAGGITPNTPEMRAIVVASWGLVMSLVLTFTCANLGGLMLARGSARGREIAIRLSVGASRLRLIRQLLMESIALAIIGGAAGLACAYGILTRPLLGQPVTAFPAGIRLTPDLRVALITFFISALSGAAFGLMPALASTRPDLVTGLKEIAASHVGRYRRFGLRNLFMSYQMAAAMLLVLMMGFAVIGIQQGANRAGPGFDTSRVYLFTVDPVRDGYSPVDSAATLAGLSQRLARVSGVEGVTLADSSAFSYMPPTLSAVSVGPAEPGTPKSIYRVSLQKVGPGFFAALGLHVMRGAEFESRDLRSDPDSGAMLRVVINQSAAQKLFGDADPMGRVIRQGEKIFQVAGIVRYEKSAVFQREPVPAVFLPLTKQDLQRGRMVVVRLRPGVKFAAIRDEMKAIDSRLTMVNVQTMDEYLAQFSQALEYVTAIYGTVGMFALILACVGLAGVTAQAVVRRRREIGIRMALGARRPQVLRLVMKEAAAMILVGSVLGIAGAAALARVILWASASIGPLNPGVLEPAQVLGPPLLLIAVAAIACYLPARRSATIDPVAALRDE